MNSNPSAYYDEDFIAAAVARGEHRNVIGGLWDEIGDLQLGFLKSRGLAPQDSLLDIGCGSLRLGVRAVEFLESGNYWGTDLSPALLDAGYEREIVPLGLDAKLPRTNLVVDERFAFPGIPSAIDFVIAQSVFTHLPLKHLRVCLERLACHVLTPCAFFFTVFIPPRGLSAMQSHSQPRGGKVTHPDRDPYHFGIEDLHDAATGTPWSIEFIGDWNHPRNQMMVRAHKS
jgi:SAM-dependent methyltransferase